jgi:membrane protein
MLVAVGKFMRSVLPAPAILFEGINFLISLAVVTVIFAAIFKYIPERNLEWRDVLLGAAVTSLLFTIGKSLIGLYLGTAAVGSSFGAAGSLVIVLVWVYYSSQILFFGAEFTQVYSKTHGSTQLKRRPADGSQEEANDHSSWAASGNSMLSPRSSDTKEEVGWAASIGGLAGSFVGLVRSIRRGR